MKHFQILIFRNNNAMEEGVNPFVPNVTFMEKSGSCHRVYPPAFCWVVEPPTKFSKRRRRL